MVLLKMLLEIALPKMGDLLVILMMMILLGNVAEIQKISYVSPRSIYGETSNE